MDTINKFQTLIILLSVATGILLGQVSFFELHSEYFILPFLVIMLYTVFVQIPLSDIKDSLKNLKFTFTAISINFIWTPLFAWILGYFFLNDSPEIWIGFLMLMVTPCTDWYLIFTGIAKGNVALGSSILPTNFILQILLLPIYLFALGGSLVEIDIASLVEGLVYVLILPLLLAYFSRKLILRLKDNDYLEQILIPRLASFQGIFLNLAIVAMFASQGKLLIDNYSILLMLLLPILIFFTVNFILVQVIGRLLKFEYEDLVALNLTTLARNSPIALAIAVASFSDKPLIALALIIGPLIELPVLATISQILIMTKSITASQDII